MKKNDVILNRYKLLSVAGSGGFGEVCVAWDKRIQRKVAIKCIKLTESDVKRAALPGANAINSQSSSETSSHESAPTSLLGNLTGQDGASATVRTLTKIPGLDEARTAATLNDTNIVSVYDFEIQGSQAFLIMEYVDGITLEQLLERYGNTISLNAIATIINSVACALQTAHDAGVLHLDIKPANILINKRGEIKVTDFGLATLADAAGQGRCAGGTIGYMPLEQIRQLNLDARTDEWALASVAYELLCGENPFFASNLKDAQQVIEQGELLLPSVCWDGLDAGIDDVIFDALDPNPRFRFATVGQFASELLPYLGDTKQGKCELAELVVAPLKADSSNNNSALLIIQRFEFKVAFRAVSALLAFGLCAAALSSINSASFSFGLSNPILWVITLPVAALSAWKPYFGLLAAICVLSFSYFCNGNFLLGFLLLGAVSALAFKHKFN